MKFSFKKKAFLFLFFCLFSVNSASAQNIFSDVSVSDINYKAIDIISGRGIVSGYNDGTFKPENYINRAEFIKIIVLSAGIYDENISTNCFSDLDTSAWYAKYVCSAKKSGVISGYEDGSFRPDNLINFVEALKITLRSMKILYAENTGPWYRGMVNTAALKNLIPLSIDSFDKKISRGEMADMIVRFLKYKESDLDSYLEEKSEFKVDYETINSGISLEDDWLNYLASLNSSKFRPVDFESNIELPSPAKGKVYRGDGKYTVTKGDQIFLNNGIVVEIDSISKVEEKDYYLIYFNYFLKGRRINFLPAVVGQKQSEFGVITEVDTLRDNNSDPRFFTISFKSKNNYENYNDLYQECISEGREKIDCFGYSVFDPLPGEKIITEGVYRVIYPEQEAELGKYFLKQMMACIPEITKETGMASKIEIIPLRIYYDEGNRVVTNRSGVFWPISPEDRDSIVINGEKGCYDPVVVHELSHFIFLPAPLPLILNEGLAYHLEKKIIDTKFDEETKLIANSKLLSANQSYTDDETQITITFLGGAREVETVAVFRIADKFNQNDFMEIGVGLNTAISSDNLKIKNKNLVLELVGLNRGVPFEATLNLYHAPPSREILHCDEAGYRNEYGWRTKEGRFINLFNYPYYDVEKRSQAGKNGEYLPLKNYLQPEYNWDDTFESFYSSGACLFRDMAAKNSENMSKVFAIVNEFRTIAAGFEDEFVEELKTRIGSDFDNAARKKELY